MQLARHDVCRYGPYGRSRLVAMPGTRLGRKSEVALMSCRVHISYANMSNLPSDYVIATKMICNACMHNNKRIHSVMDWHKKQCSRGHNSLSSASTVRRPHTYTAGIRQYAMHVVIHTHVSAHSNRIYPAENERVAPCCTNFNQKHIHTHSAYIAYHTVVIWRCQLLLL